jgi:hypothetical protein
MDDSKFSGGTKCCSSGVMTYNGKAATREQHRCCSSAFRLAYVDLGRANVT